tara:strand:+ start:103 stop:1518 length:1416 start_codon:yes stop_codon:yes gene_type:complete
MLNNLRNFSKSKFAGVLIAIIIIPFVFWGMGSVFSGGNKNNVVKINNKNISVNDFTLHIRNLGISEDYIRDNLENNFLEKLLNDLISKEIILMEIDDKSLTLNDKILLKKIKSSPEFKDDKQNFSRLKYEKFLLMNSISAPEYEMNLKNRELQNKLYDYVKGGIKNPYFIYNHLYIHENREIEIDYINLKDVYKKDFKINDLEIYIKKNQEKLIKEYIDIKYLKVDPVKLTNNKDFDDQFFKIIDEIENQISNDTQIEEVARLYDLEIKEFKNFKPNSNKKNKLLQLIYNNRNNKIDLLEQDEFYLLYEVKNIKRNLPNLNLDKDFYNEVVSLVSLENKIEFNKKILKKINNNNFTRDDFKKISNKINKMNLKNINDSINLPKESLEIIYNMSKDNFNLIVDKKNDIYLINLVDINLVELDKTNSKYLEYQNKAKDKIGNLLFESYDTIINNKYKVNVNNQTVERIKNFFR